MVLITVEMVRRKSEHNELEIGTLEELSLHQENIEKIEHLQNWCRNLQILLLQSNVINKLENLGKLKRLKYLNLALNSIERIENLEGLESLEKLDLTLNFVGDLKSVANLSKNIHLRCLILTGNPCVDFIDYRDYVLAVVPQITELDGTEITRSARIHALQNFESKERRVDRDQNEYLEKREQEKLEGVNDTGNDDFWNQPSKNTPEERKRIAEASHRIRQKEASEKPPKKANVVKLFDKDGRPLNVNQPKIPFKLYDDDEGNKILDIALYRYLDTSHLDVDVQPHYVTINVKGKFMQFVFEDEIVASRSSSRRSQTTGHLEIRMPKLGYIVPKNKVMKTSSLERPEAVAKSAKMEKVDIRKIVISNTVWEDDPEVPPLE